MCAPMAFSKSAKLRPIWVGTATRPNITSAVLYPLPVMQTTTDSA
jgi:hypothetical protein